jgi:H+/gluconate symporter-like permease
VSDDPVGPGDPGKGTGAATDGPVAAPPSPSPLELLQSRGYVGLLMVGALVGVPVAAIAYYFLNWVADAQKYFFPDRSGGPSSPPRRVTKARKP